MRNTHDKAVFCTADTHDKALAIVQNLRSSGFMESEISLVAPHMEGDIAVEGATKAPEGAASGAGGGLLLGGALGWMAGIGALAIPGLGPFIAAGPIMAALGGAAVGSTVGGLTGGLVGMGFSEYEAKRYEGYLNEGHALISVSVANDDEEDRAQKIYKDADADNISVQSVVDED